MCLAVSEQQYKHVGAHDAERLSANRVAARCAAVQWALKSECFGRSCGQPKPLSLCQSCKTADAELTSWSLETGLSLSSARDAL